MGPSASSLAPAGLTSSLPSTTPKRSALACSPGSPSVQGFSPKICSGNATTITTEPGPGADCLQRPLVPRSRFRQQLKRWRCYDFQCQAFAADFVGCHDFFVLGASERPEPVRYDGGSCGYPWVGSHLTGIRRGPASLEARVSFYKPLHAAEGYTTPGLRRFPMYLGHLRNDRLHRHASWLEGVTGTCLAMAPMVTATVPGTPRRACRAATTGCKRHALPWSCRACSRRWSRSVGSCTARTYA